MVAAFVLALAAAVGFAGSTPAFAAACTTSAQYGECPYSPYVLNNNMWGEVSGSSQTLTATSYNDWSITGSEPDTGGVKTYPEDQENYPDPSLSGISAIDQDFALTAVPACTSTSSWEVAADDWLNSPAGGFSAIEVMVWEDTCNQYPAGKLVPGETLVMGGQTFDLYAQTGADPTYTLESTTNVTSGTINMVSVYDWLEGLGYVSNTDGLSQLNMGEEIVSTGLTGSGSSASLTWTYDESNDTVTYLPVVEHQASGYCLDNTGDKTTAGNPVQLWQCLGDAAQQWMLQTWVYPTGGTYQMLANPAGNCLTVPAGEANGDQMVIEPCDATGEPDDPNQVVTEVASGSYEELQFPDVGFCADDTGDKSSDGNKIQIWSCLSDASQQWQLTS